MDYLKVGNYIKTLRKEKGLTQKELAEKLTISHQAISKWEIGETLPDTGILLNLCDILETSVDKLLNGGIFVKKTNRFIKIESIFDGFNYIEKIKECLGENSFFYRGMIEGISNKMNFDFEDAFINYKEVLYAEVIIDFLLEGYIVDFDEVKKYIKKEHLINEITKRM